VTKVLTLIALLIGDNLYKRIVLFYSMSLNELEKILYLIRYLKKTPIFLALSSYIAILCTSLGNILWFSKFECKLNEPVSTTWKKDGMFFYSVIFFFSLLILLCIILLYVFYNKNLIYAHFSLSVCTNSRYIRFSHKLFSLSVLKQKISSNDVQ
jgi:hypothetical protein